MTEQGAAVCRVCQGTLYAQALLRFQNMPGQAQQFPDSSDLEKDRGMELAVYQCRDCGLVQLSTEPVTYYREVIRAAAVSDEMTAFRRQQFAGFVKNHHLQGRKIIEIGCGRGEYLSILAESDVQAHGIEASAEAVRYCLQQGLSVEQAYLEKPLELLAHAPFDGFLFLSFLEHFPRPAEALRLLAEQLNDGAVGLVEVPDFDMMTREKMFSEFISDHLLYFTRETLTTTLNMLGFEVLDCQSVWQGYILSATVRKRKKLDLSCFLSEQEKMQKQFDTFLQGRDPENVAIWGAGHQSLAMISLMSLQSRVSCILDSAVFKQGKFSPASHLPIVSPEVLHQGNIDTVIIMAASYSDEVLGIVREQYPEIQKIAVLGESGSGLVCIQK